MIDNSDRFCKGERRLISKDVFVCWPALACAMPIANNATIVLASLPCRLVAQSRCEASPHLDKSDDLWLTVFSSFHDSVTTDAKMAGEHFTLIPITHDVDSNVLCFFSENETIQARPK